MIWVSTFLSSARPAQSGMESDPVRMSGATASNERRLSRYICFGLLLLVVLFFAGIRWRLRNIPLERDEGEYAYAGQLMLRGMVPYTAVYSMKLPGTFAAYAAILAVLGQSIAGIHIGLLFINSATTLLMFLIGRRLFDPLAGVVAAASYALLSTSQSVVGFAAHATHFVVLAALAGILLLLRAIETRRLWIYFCSGVLLGIAFLMKQPGIMFALFGAAFIAACQRKRQGHDWRSLFAIEGVYSAGVGLPFAITCLIMLAAHGFDKFWFWTVLYAREYATTNGIGEGLAVLRVMLPSVVLPAVGVWVLAGLSVTAVVWNKRAHSQRFFLLGFLVFSILAVCPGLYFRGHYFILMLPAVSLLVGVGVTSAAETLRESHSSRVWGLLPAAIFFALCLSSLYVQRDYLFRMDAFSASRSVYGFNPFPEAVAVADYLKAHAQKDASIAVLGSEPEIYFYSGLPAATRYVYTYGLMEPQPYALTMQKEMISEIEAAQPEYIVLVNVPQSFGRLPDSNGYIFSWMDSYLRLRYETVGVAEILPQTKYVWGDPAKAYRPRSSSFVKVFQKRSYIAELERRSSP